jgi:hypothetical protein
MKKMILAFGATLLAACSANNAEAPGGTGEPAVAHNESEWILWALTTAAPSFIGDNATVIAPDGTVLQEGTNGWTCQSASPMPMPDTGYATVREAVPACSDEAAQAWMKAYMAGEQPALETDGWMWMLHGDMGADNFDHTAMSIEEANPAHWIVSGPHLMMMPADVSTIANTTTDFASGAPYLMFKGTGFDHLMIPLEGYYDFQN